MFDEALQIMLLLFLVVCTSIISTCTERKQRNESSTPQMIHYRTDSMVNRSNPVDNGRLYTVRPLDDKSQVHWHNDMLRCSQNQNDHEDTDAVLL